MAKTCQLNFAGHARKGNYRPLTIHFILLPAFLLTFVLVSALPEQTYIATLSRQSQRSSRNTLTLVRRQETPQEDNQEEGATDGASQGGKPNSSSPAPTTETSNASDSPRGTPGQQSADAESSTTSPINQPSQRDSSEVHGLSPGAKAGIAIAAIAVGLTLIILAGRYFRKLEQGISEEKERQRAKAARRSMSGALVESRFSQTEY